MNYLDKITDQVKNTKKINSNTRYEEKEIDSLNLLTPQRIDLICKIKLLEKKEKLLRYDFPLKLYESHLKAFNGGKNKCSETGNDNKNNLNDFINEFDSISQSIKNDGFNSDVSLVPVGKDYILLDGAHRVASAIYYNKKVKIAYFPEIIENYNYNFFKQNLLDEKYLDYMILEYTKLKKNCFVFCIWPKANKKNRKEAYNIIRENTNVIYEKEIMLNYNGYKNFMMQIYRNFDNWLGTIDNKFKGVYSQLDPCYSPNVPLKIFVVESESLEKTLAIKKEIRDLFNIGNFSIHSTDNQKETVYMLNLLLNQNSVYFLNNANPFKYISTLKRIDKFKKEIIEQNENLDNYIVVGSSILGLFGIREANDVDFISNKSKNYKFKYADEHEKRDFMFFKIVDNSELLYDPNNYFYYDGVKFITLEVLKKYKMNREEAKDVEDIKLINYFLNKNNKLINSIICKLKLKIIFLFRNLRILIIKILKKIHLYYLLRKIVKGR